MPAETAVIICCRNEERTVAKVVRAARKALPGAEIIVADNSSGDSSAKIAEKAGARIVRVRKVGKGAAARAGAASTSAGVVVFLDADLLNPSPSKIRRLARPVLSGAADASIAFFSNRAFQGFTQMAYLPLVSLAFPECLRLGLKTPLSGQRAYRRRLLEKMKWPDGFGFEAAVNIQLSLLRPRPRIAQVNWGLLETVPKGAGSGRARELLEAIVLQAKKARRYGRIAKSSYFPLVSDLASAAKKIRGRLPD